MAVSSVLIVRQAKRKSAAQASALGSLSGSSAKGGGGRRVGGSCGSPQLAPGDVVLAQHHRGLGGLDSGC